MTKLPFNEPIYDKPVTVKFTQYYMSEIRNYCKENKITMSSFIRTIVCCFIDGKFDIIDS